jgi:hypothetical protein
MSTDFHVYVNGDEVTPPAAPASNAAEWDATWEERIDGVGAASLTVQDRNNEPGLNYGRRRDIVRMTVGVDNVFFGEVTRSRIDLPPGRPFRKWKITCSDWNTLLDLRLVGVPDGNHFTTDDGGRTHYPVDIYPVADPYDAEAHSWPTDKETIHRLFVSYIRLPEPDLSFIDAVTYVKNYLPTAALWINGEPRIHWDHTTLRSVMDELRGYAKFPLFYWVDPDLKLHWTLLPDPTINRAALGLPALFPQPVAAASAPAIVADDLSGPGTRIGGRDLFMEYDGSYMPRRAYVSGATDFIYNGGNTIEQGTGWAHGSVSLGRRRARHVLVDAQAVTTTARNAIAGHYERYGERARIKGSVTVAGRPDEMIDGWRVGQQLTVIDARLPDALNNRKWPIQRVAGRLVPGQNLRKYTLEFGDAPIERFSQKFQQVPHRIRPAHHPAREHQVIFPTSNLRPSTTYLLRSQLVDHAKRPLRQGGVPVTWSLTVLSAAGAPVSTGSLAPNRTTTNRHGETTADLTTGAATELHYKVTCRTAAQ